ncbi:hypothetical protein GGF46_004179 [Coemansia sp. RSA 552]|nr:hypothetical protein GGF46_004179 [Coemansia sp. RSA 552]
MPATLLKNSPPATRVQATTENVRVSCDPPSPHASGFGTLQVGEECLTFYSDKAGKGFSLDYPSIVIHAVARDPADTPHLYCQLDCLLPASDLTANGDNEPDSDEEQFSELRFYLEDAHSLDDMFNAMCRCAEMNPDPASTSDEAGSDDDNDGDVVQSIGGFEPSAFITSQAQLEQLTPQGRAEYERLEALLAAPDSGADDGRFDDADES